jgi:hypothetical protein
MAKDWRQSLARVNMSESIIEKKAEVPKLGRLSIVTLPFYDVDGRGTE